MVAANLLSDLGIPLILAVVGTAVAAAWPSWQALRRRRRLTALIRRELEEISPRDASPGKEWWEHLDKRFIHEEFFRRENVVENRDFLLSLHPTLVYHASQMWIAFEKHDIVQWRLHLRQLLTDEEIGEQVTSKEALKALAKWDRFRSRPVKWCTTLSASSSPDVHAAAAIAITSSGSSTGSASAFAIDSALM